MHFLPLQNAKPGPAQDEGFELAQDGGLQVPASSWPWRRPRKSRKYGSLKTGREAGSQGTSRLARTGVKAYHRLASSVRSKALRSVAGAARARSGVGGGLAGVELACGLGFEGSRFTKVAPTQLSRQRRDNSGRKCLGKLRHAAQVLASNPRPEILAPVARRRAGSSGHHIWRSAPPSTSVRRRSQTPVQAGEFGIPAPGRRWRLLAMRVRSSACRVVERACLPLRKPVGSWLGLVCCFWHCRARPLNGRCEVGQKRHIQHRAASCAPAPRPLTAPARPLPLGGLAPMRSNRSTPVSPPPGIPAPC